MNTHLHLLEALTNLYRARPNEGRAKRLEELIAVFRRHIINRTSSSRYLDHFFDEEWNLRSETHTFGHDIEAAWLLCETAEVLGHEQLVSETRRWATDLARTTLNQGVGADGGLAYEGRNTTVINPDRDWWCQAEAVVGFWHAYQLTGESEFADASLATWRFIDRFLVDRELGDWFSRVGPDGVVDTGEPKVSEWKGPYHNVRMCLEMMRRLGGANGVSG